MRHAQPALTTELHPSPSLWQMVGGSGCSGAQNRASSLSLEMQETVSGPRSADAVDTSGQCCCLYCEQSERGWGLGLKKDEGVSSQSGARLAQGIAKASEKLQFPLEVTGRGIIAPRRPAGCSLKAGDS